MKAMGGGKLPGAGPGGLPGLGGDASNSGGGLPGLGGFPFKKP